VKITLTPDQQAPREARSFVSTQLAGSPLPADVTLADIALIASELVTNAVLAGAAYLELTLTVSRRQLDLIVEDDARGWPVAAAASDDATRGRGLSIVEQISDRWHVTRTRRGKRVTATWFATGAMALE
jgi:anti-sigma regulatory factor (Ser/Thr protein kinase)